MLEAILHIQPPSTLPFISTLPSTSLLQLAFVYRRPISTTWTSLGLSNPPPPPPLPQPPLFRIRHTILLLNTTTVFLFTTSPDIFHCFINSKLIPLSSYPNTSLPYHSFHSFPSDPFSYKPPKLDLPRFTGDDVIGFLAMAEQYIRVQCIPSHERVCTVTSHFGLDASVWINSLEQHQPNITWE